MEEILLSEKMTQLKTKTILTTINDRKIKNSSMSLDQTIQDCLEKIPIYLKKENKTFQTIIDQALTMMSMSILKDNIQDDLQDISFLIYKMNILAMYHSLWTTYWKSGLGQLIKQASSEQQHYVVYSMNISIWPKEIKQIIKSINEQNSNNYISSMDLVCYHREELEKQLRETQIEWNKRVHHFSGYNMKVEQLLQNYIQQHLNEFQKEIEHKIKLVTYDYHIEAIKQEFYRQNPTEYEVCIYSD